MRGKDQHRLAHRGAQAADRMQDCRVPLPFNRLDEHVAAALVQQRDMEVHA